jgi:ABC-2 type transport system permease protein
MASRVASVQTLMPMVQLALMPLMFLSGSLFPVSSGLPTWLALLTRLNPMSYGVAAMRTIVFNSLPKSSATAHMHVGLTWLGWPVPPGSMSSWSSLRE